LNISKLDRELNKDRKTIRNNLNRKTPSTTRKRIRYLDEYRASVLKLRTDKYRTFDYIDCLHNYSVRHVRMDDEINSLFNKKKTQNFH